MRISRTRFSKRRSKRKTEFPIIAVVQKKRKPINVEPDLVSRGLFADQSRSTSTNANDKNQGKIKENNKIEVQKKGFDFSKTSKEASSDTIKEPKADRAKQVEKTKLFKPEKKSRATIDYKNVILLRNLITAEGKILPRRINKLTAKQQRHVQKAIKSARIMGLVPFINKSRPFA